MKKIQSAKNLKGKKVLVRVDFNLPFKNGKVEDDFRVRASLPTLNFLQKKGAKIILISHLGKGGEDLAPVAKVLNKYISSKFVDDIFGEKTKSAVASLKDGEIILLQNLRNDDGEQSKSKIFALNLAQLADIYVNEAFSVSHRSDASIVLLPKLLPSYAGIQLEKEVANLSRVFKKTKHPFLFILGGAKFSTKMPLIKKYLKLADYIFIGGALANDFLKIKGYEVGQSMIDDAQYDLGSILKNKKIILPTDVMVQKGTKILKRKVGEVEKDEVIIDIGGESVSMLEDIVKKSKMILWNGPLGKFEVGGDKATKELLKLVANSKAESVLGGGDTSVLVDDMKIGDKFSFVSTGGGATLDFLVDGELVGIKALR